MYLDQLVTYMRLHLEDCFDIANPEKVSHATYYALLSMYFKETVSGQIILKAIVDIVAWREVANS